MSAELIKKLYTWAVIVLAVVAVMHLVEGAKHKHHKRDCAPIAADQISPTWWRPTVAAPRSPKHSTRMTLAGL